MIDFWRKLYYNWFSQSVFCEGFFIYPCSLIGVIDMKLLMAHKKSPLTKSIRIYIRRKKAEIRRAVDDPQQRQEKINALYARFLSQPKTNEQETKPQVKPAPAKTQSGVKVKKPSIKKPARKASLVKSAAPIRQTKKSAGQGNG